MKVNFNEIKYKGFLQRPKPYMGSQLNAPKITTFKIQINNTSSIAKNLAINFFGNIFALR